MLELPSEIDFENAEAVKQRGYELIKQSDRALTIDVGMIAQANSLAVAVLSAWHRRSTLQSKSIVFVNLSQELRNIIALSGLDDVIAIDPAN